ncbi:hypothetical protein P9112_000670 [Eukaryota sp. TZLM1-RC]
MPRQDVSRSFLVWNPLFFHSDLGAVHFATSILLSHEFVVFDTGTVCLESGNEFFSKMDTIISSLYSLKHYEVSIQGKYTLLATSSDHQTFHVDLSIKLNGTVEEAEIEVVVLRCEQHFSLRKTKETLISLFHTSPVTVDSLLDPSHILRVVKNEVSSQLLHGESSTVTRSTSGYHVFAMLSPLEISLTIEPILVLSAEGEFMVNAMEMLTNYSIEFVVFDDLYVVDEIMLEEAVKTELSNTLFQNTIVPFKVSSIGDYLFQVEFFHSDVTVSCSITLLSIRLSPNGKALEEAREIVLTWDLPIHVCYCRFSSHVFQDKIESSLAQALINLNIQVTLQHDEDLSFRVLLQLGTASRRFKITDEQYCPILSILCDDVDLFPANEVSKWGYVSRDENAMFDHFSRALNVHHYGEDRPDSLIDSIYYKNNSTFSGYSFSGNCYYTLHVYIELQKGPIVHFMARVHSSGYWWCLWTALTTFVLALAFTSGSIESLDMDDASFCSIILFIVFYFGIYFLLRHLKVFHCVCFNCPTSL